MQTRLGRYQLLTHLASGGMADVLLGRSDGLEGFTRHVVVKRIRPEYAQDARFIRMFLDEARLAATLHHQHIVQVHDVGESEGEYFFAMEYIHGEDVRKLLATASKARSHVPLPIALAIITAAAAGLHYAHERRGSDRRPLGLVHCDISPSNILVGYDGSVKVLDFGIARAAAIDSPHTATGSGSHSLKGKLGYMAPEQCKAIEIDRRTDIYGLGVTLYELATTSRLIKKAGTYDMADQIVHGRVTLPQVRRPDLPDELATIIMRAISPNPDRRFSTAEEMRLALEQFAANAGLMVTTSQIASYMRKQFGERPEPWLELDSNADDFEAEELPPPPPRQKPTWSDVSGAFVRQTGSFVRQTGPIAVGSAPKGTGPVAAMQSGASPIIPPPVSELAAIDTTAPAPQFGAAITSRAKRVRPVMTTQRLAIVTTIAVLVVFGVAAWKFGVSSNDEHATSDGEKPVATTPAPGPTVTPLPAVAPPAPPPVDSAPAKVPTDDKALGAIATTHNATTTKRSNKPQVTVTKEARNAPTTHTPEQPPATPKVAVSPTPDAPPAPAPEAPPVVAKLEAPPPPVLPAKPVPVAPQLVQPAALEANRLAGDRSIAPDEVTQNAIARAGVEKLSSSFKMCVAADGRVEALTQLKSSGFAAYDQLIQRTISAQWRYKPFMVKGTAMPVCTAVKFVYSQK